MKVVSQQRQIKKNKEIKVLLSFLDTGPLDPKENRTYRTTEYHLGETNLGKYPFVSSALKKHYQVDTLLLMGTFIPCGKRFTDGFQRIPANPFRSCTAHSLETVTNVPTMLQIITDSIEELEKII